MTPAPRSSLRAWSVLWYLLGICLLVGGCFFSFGGPLSGVGSAGSAGASIGASFISIGFLLSLFARLEERVMRVERLLAPATTQPAEAAPIETY